MMLRRSINITFIFGLLAAMLIGCGSPAPQPPAQPGGPTSAAAANGPAPAATPEKNNAEVGPNEAQIFMLEPQDGSALDSPFFLRVGVSNFKIPISSLRIHVAIDAACTPPGGTIPEDAQHISLPQGSLVNPRFELPLGAHRLCVQASNQDNIALQGPGMARVIDVTIESVPEQNND
ncbi:MAG: hypothetical protein HGB05_16115 [Chloroflexi bacterium]|nr:hypothetical protein [Chloroflexota bacterium]